MWKNKKNYTNLIINFPLTSCSKKESSETKNENFSKTLKDVEFIIKNI